MIPRVPRWLIAGALMVSSQLITAQANQNTMQPSLEMLEYLGLLVEGEEGFIGPESLDGNSIEEPPEENTQIRRRANERDELMINTDGASNEGGF